MYSSWQPILKPIGSYLTTDFKPWLELTVQVDENDAVVSIGKQTLWPAQNDLRPRFILRWGLKSDAALERQRESDKSAAEAIQAYSRRPI